MRYALFSDIHGNQPALTAVLTDLARRAGAATPYHLGDLVGYGPFPNEVVATLRDAAIAGVAGNYDSTVATDYAHCGCRYEDPAQEALAHLSYEWTRAQVTAETRAYLGSLPFRIDLRPDGGHRKGPTVTLLHGNQVLNTVYLEETRPDALLEKMAAALAARPGDVVCFGHTHRPWHRVVDGVHFVNTGSVGKPKDGDWRAGYVLLEVAGPEFAVEFVRVAYDLDAMAAALRAGGLPDALAEQLRRGGAPAGGLTGTGNMLSS